MSTANDPFNFDDIYKQAGVDNLFIKKSMAEQKAMAPRPGAATPPRPAVQNGVGPCGASAAGHGGTPQAVQQGSPVKGFTSSSPALGSSNSLKGMDLDPFADLGGLGRPTAMAASKSSPPTAARSPTPAQSVLANSSSHPAAAPPARSASPAAAPAPSHPFDLEDMFGPTANSSPQPQRRIRSTVAAIPEAAGSPVDNPFDPFTAFDSVEGAAAAVPATPLVPASAPTPTPSAAEPPAQPMRPSRAATPVQQQPQPVGSNSPSTAPAAREAAKPSSLYFAELDQQQQQQQPRQHSRMDPDGGRGHITTSRYSANAEHPSSSIGAAQHRLEAAAADRYLDGYGSPTSSSYDFGQAGYHEQAGGGGKSWGGLLKSVTKTAAVIGKKGLKAAQAGLAQLESAIENLDRPPSSSDRPHSGSGGGPGGDVDVPAERVLSIAIHISELPSTRQEEALTRLPRPVRQKVLALLREQAVVEGQDQVQQPAAAGGVDDVIHTREFDLGDAHEPAAAATASARAERSSAPAGRDPPAAAVQPPPAATAVAPTAAAPSPVQVVEDDLLGMASPVAAAAAATPPAAAKVASVCDIDDFFSGGPPAAAAAAAPSANVAKPGQAAAVLRPRSAGPVRSNGSSGLSRVSGSDGRLADLLGGASSSAAAGAGKGSSMIHLGGLEALDVDVGSYGALYNDGGAAGDSSEPEIRRQLRAARAADKHAKMKAALAEQQAKEAAETERRQQQQAHKQAHKERIETWKNKNKGNVRGLLGSLQTVLWQDSNWKPIGMGDLLEPAQVRKAWMKANLLVHPDKVRQRNGSDEQVAIADMIFDALKEAWGQFRV